MKEAKRIHKMVVLKQSELKQRRRQLRNSVAEFLISFKMMTADTSLFELKKIFTEGFKGYQCMRGKELIKNFEDVYANLRDKKYKLNIERNADGSDISMHYWDDSDNDAAKTKENLLFQTEALMTMIMEVAFDLGE